MMRIGDSVGNNNISSGDNTSVGVSYQKKSQHFLMTKTFINRQYSYMIHKGDMLN